MNFGGALYAGPGLTLYSQVYDVSPSGSGSRDCMGQLNAARADRAAENRSAVDELSDREGISQDEATFRLLGDMLRNSDTAERGYIDCMDGR